MLDRKGVLAAILAYSAWGFFPLYWQFLKHISSLEIMSHRVIWSLLFYVVIANLRTGPSKIREVAQGVLRNALQRKRVAVAALLIGANWLLYIWGVTHEHVMETSLGYFMTPLLNVAIGRVILKEKLSLLQWLSLGLAAIAVTWLTVDYGHPPWLALGLALTFAAYGYIKKLIGSDATIVSILETAMMLPFAIGLAIYIRQNGAGSEVPLLATTATLQATDWLLLIGGGAVTGIPLLFFAVAAQRLPLSVLGFFQYLAPSFQFITAVFLFHEPLSTSRLIGFAFIWTALILFLWHLVLGRKQNL